MPSPRPSSHTLLRQALTKTLEPFAALQPAPAVVRPVRFEAPCDCPPWRDRLVCFEKSRWLGAARFIHPIDDISSFGPIRSLRANPFVIELVYHVVADGFDLPGGEFDPDGLFDVLSQLVELDARLVEVHRRVQRIWLPYLVDLRKTRMFVFHWGPDAKKYFDLQSGEFGELASDDTLGLDKRRLHGFITNGTPGIGVANSNDIDDGDLDRPVFAAEMFPTIDRLARTIAHEIGHVFGLSHGENNNPYRLMSQTAVPQAAGVALRDSCTLSNVEVDRVHTNLASNDQVNPGFRRE